MADYFGRPGAGPELAAELLARVRKELAHGAAALPGAAELVRACRRTHLFQGVPPLPSPEEARCPQWPDLTSLQTRNSRHDHRLHHAPGSALLEALKQHARSAGFDTLIVWPSERSSPLWQRSGFQPPEELLELPLDT